MFLNLFGEKSSIYKLFITLFVIFISTLFIMIIATLISIPLFDISIKNVLEPDFTNNNLIKVLKFLQAIQSIAMFVIPPILLAILFSKKPKEYLNITKTPFLISVLSVSFIMLFSIPVINYLAEINSNMTFPESFSAIEKIMKNLEEEAKVITDVFLKADSIVVLFVNIIVIALIPSIGEELLFRGVFQKLFTDLTKNVHIGVWIAAFLFSAMHLQFYGFLPRLVMGAMLGYMLVFSKNLWLPIIAHFINNAFAVTVYYLSNKNIIEESNETIGAGENAFSSLIISVFLVVSLAYIFYRYEKNTKPQLEKL